MGIEAMRGANAMMADMMKLLMAGMQEQMDLSKDMIAVGVENQIIGDKMAIAQQIIDVYA